MNQFNKIRIEIKNSDFVIEVVDSRCALLYHCPQICNICKKENKEFLVAVAKCELLPVYFKKKILQKFNEFEINIIFVSSKTKYGIMQLKSFLKSRIKNKKEKRKILLLGLPNAGKSTLVNTLIGKHKAGTSPVPGHTKGIQYLKMSKNIMLCDTKGITNIRAYNNLEEAIFSKNIQNASFLIEKIIETKKGNLKHYGVDLKKCKKNADVFLEDLAKEKNLILKNNIVDINRAKEKIISDWHKGKLISWWID